MMEVMSLPKDALKTALQAQNCKDSFYWFFRAFWPEFSASPFSDNWHIEFLCDELQECYNRFQRGEKARNILINVPPGTSKSSIVTIAFPVWLWIKDPSLKIISGSYSERIALTHSVKSRDIVRSDKFRKYFPGIEIKRDVDNKTMYENTHMGARFTCSVGGSVTGMHGHFCILDDMLSSDQANSEVFRDTANRFVSETLSTRKVDKFTVPIIVVMQRLHALDTSGYMLDRDPEMIHICLPGELSPDVKPEMCRDMYTNGLLDVNRLSRLTLDQLKIDLGSYGYSGQIQQRPSPLNDGIWRKDWFKVIDDEDIPEDLDFHGSDWDLAYSEKETNSACAFVTAGKRLGKMYITRIGFRHVEFPQLIEFMKAQQGPHYIEAKASGKSAKQTLSSMGIPAIEVNVKGGDKVARATLSTPYAEAGMIYVSRTYIDKLLYDSMQGITFFPNGSHDDLSDALTQSIQRIFQKRQFFIN